MKNYQKQQILTFINNVTNSDLKKANSTLENIVNEKIKQRIAIANKNLSSQK